MKLYSILLLSLSACASFESRFTSHTGCSEDEIKVLKNDFVLIGPKSYTISCKNTVYYCTENFVEGQHSNLKCKKSRK
ncbi:MAG: hypothetical protein QF441_01915 [Bacteriovoracaceae bacterium]|nr:hypothetical protein [Bacteriovoracaceae bacterium]